MKDVQRDTDGDLRCPKCGARAFRPKRSFKAKAMLLPTVGVGALAAPKRLKCLSCGELLKAGNAQPVGIPAAPGVPASIAPRTGGCQVLLGKGGSMMKLTRWLTLHTDLANNERAKVITQARKNPVVVLQGLSQEAAELRAQELRDLGAVAQVVDNS